jgi:hypothetical protein
MSARGQTQPCAHERSAFDTPNSREETLMRWTPQQAKPQLRNRKRNSAGKDAAMNARGKAIWQGIAPPRNLKLAARNLQT